MLKDEPGECDLEHLVASNEGGELGERLFARSSHPHQQGITPRCADDARDPHQVHHGILKEHEVHPRASDTLIVLRHEHLQPLLQQVEVGNLQMIKKHLQFLYKQIKSV